MILLFSLILSVLRGWQNIFVSINNTRAIFFFLCNILCKLISIDFPPRISGKKEDQLSFIVLVEKYDWLTNENLLNKPIKILCFLHIGEFKMSNLAPKCFSILKFAPPWTTDMSHFWNNRFSLKSFLFLSFMKVNIGNG